MASVAVGPGGISIAGDHQCSNNNLLMDQGSPLGGLVNMLIEQQLTGLTRLEYDDVASAMDRHMPLRASTATNLVGTNFYHTDVGYTGLYNQGAPTSITPSIGNYTNTQQFLNECGIPTLKGISSSANINSEACNPSINGPMPSIGREAYGREAFVSRLPVPPICFGDWVNKDEFYAHLSAILGSVRNAVVTKFGADQHRWMISRSRFNASALQVPSGNGRARLIDDPSIFTQFSFGHVPTSYGSPDWLASVLRYSEVPPRQNVTVELPAAIFKRYKENLAMSIGINVWEQAPNITAAVNGYIRNILEEKLVYTDEITGRKITFMSTTKPIYVEVEETGPLQGTWQYQEPWVTRDSETSGQIMRRANPNWGRACSCNGKVLAAIITITADDGPKPFYKETLPSNNPDTRLRSLISQYARNSGREINTTLAEIYPTSAELVIWTGIEAQRYALDPINQRYRDAGNGCDVVSNIENTWMAGYAKIAAQFVENRPREILNIMVKMPVVSSCVELFTDCNPVGPAPTAGEIVPVLNEPYRQPVPIPDPIPVPAGAAGVIAQIGNRTAITADCTQLKTVVIRFRRTGGSTGAISVNIAGTASAHANTLPTVVNFADGQLEASVSFTIDAWAESPQATENFTLTLSGASLDPDTYSTRTICIKSNPNCPGVCDVDAESCSSCG